MDNDQSTSALFHIEGEDNVSRETPLENYLKMTEDLRRRLSALGYDTSNAEYVERINALAEEEPFAEAVLVCHALADAFKAATYWQEVHRRFEGEELLFLSRVWAHSSATDAAYIAAKTSPNDPATKKGQRIARASSDGQKQGLQVRNSEKTRRQDELRRYLDLNPKATTATARQHLRKKGFQKGISPSNIKTDIQEIKKKR